MIDPSNQITELLRRDPRYRFDAYVFVWEALRFAQEKLGMGAEFPGERDDEEPERHVSGQELCEAMRRYAHEQYGYLAKEVLNHWGVHSTGDFGEIVFNLIEIGKMRKSPSDHREDFDGVFDFESGFLKSFEFSMPDSSEETR